MVLRPGEVMFILLMPRFSAHNGNQWEVPLVPSGTLGTQHFHVKSQCRNSLLSFRKVKEHFCTEKKEKDPWMSSFVFSWLMLEFLFLTYTCKPVLPRYKLFWFFTTITSCYSCLDCWRSSMILMSILWEAAFPCGFPFTHCRAIFILKKKRERKEKTVTNLMGYLQKTI